MSQPTTISEVLNELDAIINDTIANNDRLGLFAYIYRRTTAEVLKEVQLKNFEDNERMEKLDVEFANLYLKAYKDYQEGLPVSSSWALAFSNKGKALTILQHIMLGMNAHINLDLSIATSSVMSGKDIQIIENDFDRINNILRNIIDELQDRLSRVSPLFFLMDLAGKNSDEKIIDFSMRKARQQAWNSANLIWSVGNGQTNDLIKTVDASVVKVGEFIAKPRSKIFTFLLKTIGWFEHKDIGKTIRILQQD